MGDLVSIIIVNYNTERVLQDCIQSIKDRTKNVDYEIIVVDNNSAKGSLDSLQNTYPDVKVYLMSDNLGFGGANNYAAQMVKGGYLFFLNPDTVLINNAILELYLYLKENSTVGICGGNLYKEDMSPAVSYHTLDFYKREIMVLLNRKWQIGFNRTGKPQKVNVIMGADLFMKKSLFEEMKGFDTDFFMYFEEVELCDRVRRKGYDIMSVPSAQIIHLEGAAAENKNEELKKWSYNEQWYSKLVYFSKKKGIFQTKLLYWMNIWKLSLALSFYKMGKNENKLEYWTMKKEVIQKAYDRYRNYLQDKRE